MHGYLGWVGQISALVDGNLMEKNSLCKVLSTQKNMSARRQHETRWFITGKKPRSCTCAHTLSAPGSSIRQGTKRHTQSHNFWAQQPPKMSSCYKIQCLGLRREGKKKRTDVRAKWICWYYKKQQMWGEWRPEIFILFMQLVGKIHIHEPK